jgi:peptidyl-prolyl cis-trans isomerase C
MKRLLPLLWLLSAVGCARPHSNDPVILALGEGVVRKSDFERHVKTLEAQGGGPLDPAARQSLLEQFLEDRAMVLEARSRGLLAAGATVTEEGAAIQKLLAASLPAHEVSEVEIAADYAAHPDEHVVPEAVTLLQILLPTNNEARDVLRRLQKVPRSFESLARTRSRAPEAESGGLMGSFARGQLPAELEQEAFSLPVGSTSGVIESPLGFHILRVESREPERQLGLDECRERIRSKLQRQQADRSVKEFVQALMARCKVNHEAANAVPDRS